MLQSVDFLNIDINESLKTLFDSFLILSFDKNLSWILLFHCHSRSDLNFELLIFGLFIMLGFFQYWVNNILLFSHFTLHCIGLVILWWWEQDLILSSLEEFSSIHFIDFFLWFALDSFHQSLWLTNSLSHIHLLFESSSLLIVVTKLCFVIVLLLVTVLRGLVFEHVTIHSTFFIVRLFFDLSSFLSPFILFVFFLSFRTTSLFTWYIIFVDTLFLFVVKLLIEKLSGWVLALIVHFLCICSI